jgi:hypothetical protein
MAVDNYARGKRERRPISFLQVKLFAPAAIKVMGDSNDTKANWPHQLLVDSFARLCADAGRVGMKVGIEIMPWTNSVRPPTPCPSSGPKSLNLIFRQFTQLVVKGLNISEVVGAKCPVNIRPIRHVT